jgi:hypothetical protein
MISGTSPIASNLHTGTLINFLTFLLDTGIDCFVKIIIDLLFAEDYHVLGIETVERGQEHKWVLSK